MAIQAIACRCMCNTLPDAQTLSLEEDSARQKGSLLHCIPLAPMLSVDRHLRIAKI